MLSAPAIIWGVNRDSVDRYAGSAGEGITIISAEIDAWNTSHANLPPMSLSSGKTTYVANNDHDTASVGIMAAKDRRRYSRFSLEKPDGVCGLRE